MEVLEGFGEGNNFWCPRNLFCTKGDVRQELGIVTIVSKKRANSKWLCHGVVVCELREGQAQAPIVLLVVDGAAEVLFHDHIDTLGLAVGLRVKGVLNWTLMVRVWRRDRWKWEVKVVPRSDTILSRMP